MKIQTSFMLILFVLLTFVACNAAADVFPAVQIADSIYSPTAQSEARATIEEFSAADCPKATPSAHQLIDAARGICLLYPENFDLFEHSDGSGYTLYIRSLMGNHISFTFEPANGRSLEEVTTQRLTDYAFPDTKSQAINLGSEPASMLDNLPGQDTNRRVVVVHDDRVIDIFIEPIGENYGAAGEQAIAAYDMIANSFQFINMDPEATLLAGPECPEPVENSTIYTNEPAGYCLLVPAAYTLQEISPDGSEIAFVVDAIQNVTNARLFIAVEDTDGRTLDEIVADKEAEIEKALPGLDLLPSFGYMVDGVIAHQFDQVPGQDLSRLLFTVHDGRLYTLTFIPDDPTADAYAEMETLYGMVIDSFSFTTTE